MIKKIICWFLKHHFETVSEYEDGTSEHQCKRCGHIEHWEEYTPRLYRRIS